MCRLLGVVTARPRLLTDSLAEELGPFTELSTVHCDGWGIAAWSPGDDLVVHREATAAGLEPSLTALCGRTETDAALLHMRKASDGIPVTPANTHPFSVGSIAFAHNGFFPPTAAVDELLASLDAEPVVGDTDSERYFRLVGALLRTHDPAAALHRAAALLAERVEVVALNALMLTHQALYAFASYDEAAEPDLEADSYQLRFRVTDGIVRVTSTGYPQPHPTWERLPNNAILEINRTTLDVTVHRPAHP
jgi:predicted glutamine amidotransferase